MALSTSSLIGQKIKLSKSLLIKEPTFIIRYWLVGEITHSLTGGAYKDKKIIDIGGNGSPLPDILDKKIDLLDLPENNYENYIKASALDMPIKDHSYDIVTSCDVYEHIKQDDRQTFIKELLRISKEFVILCGPMYSPESAAAEKRVNNFFNSIFGREHPWLNEHITYGLPKATELEEILKEEGINFIKFDHGCLPSWELITKLNFLSVEGAIADDDRIEGEIEALNNDYISKYGPHDFCEKGYRTIYIIDVSGSGSLIKFDTPKVEPGIEDHFSLRTQNILAGLASSIRVHSHNEDLLNIEATELLRHNHALQEELNGIYDSKLWFFFRVARKLISILKKIFRKIGLTQIFKWIKSIVLDIAMKTPYIRRILSVTHAEIQRKKNQRLREYEYLEWVRQHRPTSFDLEDQAKSSTLFKSQPLISIIMPTYNTQPDFLKTCIESVQNQSYRNWELCIADDASPGERTQHILSEYANSDTRIKVKFRKKNGHICAASNSALELASGKYIALLDHDDFLWANALYEVVATINRHPDADLIYSDEDKIDQKGLVHSDPFFKPDWSPDYLRSVNYITHFAVIRKQLMDKVGGFRLGYEGAQDWDLFLRLSRETSRIYHIPKIIYSWRKSNTSTALLASAKKYAYTNQRKALMDDATARGLEVRELKWGVPNLMWRSDYKLNGVPKVSIIIPTKDQYPHISKCLATLYRRTTYSNFEVVLVDTGSGDKRVWQLYEKYRQHQNFKQIQWNDEFNFSDVCNFGAQSASGEYLLFLNNDTEIITRDWVQGLLQFAQQPHAGAVGCKLLYPNHTLQHAGVILGVGGNNQTPGIAGHFYPAYQDNPPEDSTEALYIGGVRDFSAVTAACVMVSKTKFNKVGGFDGKFKIAWNDVDFCLKLRKEGLFNIFNPYVKLFHHESVSVGVPGSKHRDLNLFNQEIKLFGEKWGWDYINNDPYYNPNFRRDTANARLSLD
ncbi:MAG TPA: glycosyltransferase [Candidatus Saccharimonadales bacterium]|nr:glycosyltransferase [Candidatus Saccharimonadales bacterium]